ncbi:hypothetical protein DM860_008924 [Cuscuta australis]|uniref:Kinesin-like protein n=1 Tax=Cuscuta australis TaxID=267555 RepID=A0A328D7C9_9ASTE|nr:hypothetical protein DM860_008924 [Cuscuta australis]
MNAAVGRQRSGAAAAAHHQRQYSDNFLDTLSNGKWLQSAGLQHLQTSSNSVHHSQGSRVQSGLQRSGGYGAFAEPLTPPANPRPSGQRKNGSEPNEFSPGLLDLYSLDTELLPEIPDAGQYGAPSVHNSAQGKSFDDLESYFVNNKQTGRVRGLADMNVTKSFVADKEKSSSVAKIKVVVRKRPMNKKELAKNDDDIIEMRSNSVVVHETKLKVDLTQYVENHEFVFDAVLNEEVSNDEVYRETVEPIVPIIFQSTKATCFAYGQTGSGKTFTMKPLPLKASRDILSLMHYTYRNHGFQLFVSFFEIYQGKLFDLLNDRKKLCMREDAKQQVCIVGLLEYRVSDVEMIKELIDRGNATRSTGITGANEESSRSHAILQLSIKKSADASESKPARLVGKLSFIDLAGSERGADTTDNDKQTRIEGAEINKSLLALKECIRALDNDQGHIPFRGSKLTEVLRDSFVGNSRTVMISCISPNSGSCEHTLNTLRYADRVKSLSKGNNSKKDVSSSTLNLRESTMLPLNMGVVPSSTYEDDMDNSWLERTKKDDYEDDFYEQDKPISRKNVKVEASSISNPEEKRRRNRDQPKKWKESLRPESKARNDDDDLNSLLKEEEDLVNAHRRQVEETMDIVRQEMNLLVEADQPGNWVDDYISRLNSILSKKANAILEMQNRLALFQRHLMEHNVLASDNH